MFTWASEWAGGVDGVPRKIGGWVSWLRHYGVGGLAARPNTYVVHMATLGLRYRYKCMVV